MSNINYFLAQKHKYLLLGFLISFRNNIDFEEPINHTSLLLFKLASKMKIPLQIYENLKKLQVSYYFLGVGGVEKLQNFHYNYHKWKFLINIVNFLCFLNNFSPTSRCPLQVFPWRRSIPTPPKNQCGRS